MLASFHGMALGRSSTKCGFSVLWVEGNMWCSDRARKLRRIDRFLKILQMSCDRLHGAMASCLYRISNAHTLLPAYTAACWVTKHVCVNLLLRLHFEASCHASCWWQLFLFRRIARTCWAKGSTSFWERCLGTSLWEMKDILESPSSASDEPPPQMQHFSFAEPSPLSWLP